MQTRFELFVEAVGVDVSAGLQGAPLANLSGEAGQQARIPVDWWLLDEDNALTAEVSPVEGAREAYLTLALVLPAARHDPLAVARWRWGDGVLTDPFAARLPFFVAGPPARLSAIEPVAALERTDVAAIRALVATLADVVARRDAAALVVLLDHRIREFCATFGDDVDEHRAVVHDDLAEMMAAMSIDLVAPEEIRISPCAGDRVFHIAKIDGSELFVWRNTEGESAMQVYVARIEGVWQVVR